MSVACNLLHDSPSVDVIGTGLPSKFLRRIHGITPVGLLHFGHRANLCQAASAPKREELQQALRRLVLAADAHVADLYSCGKGQDITCQFTPGILSGYTRFAHREDFIKRWSGGLRSEISAMLEGSPMHPLPFQQMRGAPLFHMPFMAAAS